MGLLREVSALRAAGVRRAGDRVGRVCLAWARTEWESAERAARHLKAELKRADLTFEELAERLKKHSFNVRLMWLHGDGSKTVATDERRRGDQAASRPFPVWAAFAKERVSTPEPRTSGAGAQALQGFIAGVVRFIPEKPLASKRTAKPEARRGHQRVLPGWACWKAHA